jgi:hypothetical protein
MVEFGFIVMYVVSIVAATLAQYYHDKYERAKDAIMFMVEDESDEEAN